ncbi:Serine protease 44 [Halotydeus destructor]|nr:Serine protease 44 [Halotydeus destructor]
MGRVILSVSLGLVIILCATSVTVGWYTKSSDIPSKADGQNSTTSDSGLKKQRYDNPFSDPNNASLYINYPTELFKKANDTRETRGRSLDLDALLGEPSQETYTGDRESRIVNDPQPGLAIQGFIPIVSFDANKKARYEKQQTHAGHQSFLPHNQPQQQHQPHHQQHQPQHQPHYQSNYVQPNHQTNHQPVYQPSGHHNFHQGQPDNHFQEEPKFLGGALQGLASAFRPKRKQGTDGIIGQDCLCVPFYMCKNGFLENTGKNSQPNNGQYATKEQIEQQFAVAASEASKNFGEIPPQLSSFVQQGAHQGHRPQQNGDHYESASSHDSPQLSASQAAFEPADLPLDERQVDGDLTLSRSPFNASEGSPQYVSDVLARMLGGPQQGGPQSCGVLRTCCRVAPDQGLLGHGGPFSLPQGSELYPQPIQHPGQRPPYALRPQVNLPFMRPPFRKENLGSFAITGASLFKPKLPVPVQGPSAHFGQFNNPLPQFLGKPHHGFPQPSHNIRPGGPLNSLLAHRPPRPSHIQQLPPPPPHIPSYPPGHFSSPTLNHVRPHYGSCGARNAVGIHGRVSTLQYHESSSEFGEYPWQVALLKRIGPQDSLYVCGAVMISPEWIITAAHCIKKNTPADLKVRFGEWDVHREDEFYPYVEKFVRDIIVHSDYYPGNLINDIALIRIDSPVDLGLPHIAPICLPEPYENFAGHRCWVTGWGKNSFGHQGEYQSVLKEVDLPVIDNAHCQQALRHTRLGPNYHLHPGFVCAGGEAGKDACEGDGGSPLVCEVGGVWKVAGIVSWGIGCGQAGVPGVYASMTYYRDWIDSIVGKFGAFPPASLISERSNSISNDTLRESRSESTLTVHKLNSTESTPTTTTSTTTIRDYLI